MNRRKVLASIVGTSATALAGCSGISALDMGGRKVGDTATYQGVKFTPTGYLLSDKVTLNFGNNSETRTADSGATYILTHLKVVHDGDSAQEFPPNGSGRDAIDLYYDGELVGDSMLAKMAQSYTISNKELSTYHSVRSDRANGEVYPGTKIDGWILNEVASNFDPAKLQLRVVWNQQMVGDEGEVTHKWAYTTDEKMSISNVTGGGSTITL